MAPKLLLIGGGKMGSALLSGLVAAGWAPIADLAVSDPDPAQRARLEAAHPGLSVVGGPIEGADVLLAVKPDVAEAALRALGVSGPRRVLSIVAGISSERWSVFPRGTSTPSPASPGQDRPISSSWPRL